MAADLRPDSPRAMTWPRTRPPNRDSLSGPDPVSRCFIGRTVVSMQGQAASRRIGQKWIGKPGSRIDNVTLGTFCG